MTEIKGINSRQMDVVLDDSTFKSSNVTREHRQMATLGTVVIERS